MTELAEKDGLVFDDEPIDSVLYGTGHGHATPVDVFLPIKEHMGSLRDAFSSGDTEALVGQLVEITDRELVLHKPICDEIVDITASIIPVAPLPTLPYDIIGLTPLFEQIWELQQTSQDLVRSVAVGDRLYKCYEHQGRYEDARRILTVLIRIARTANYTKLHAFYTNNLAFEYLLEQRWQDAMPVFQQAEQLSFELDDRLNCANSRSNYLTCVFALRPAIELQEFRAELEDLAGELSNAAPWQARKPYVLLSRILEANNDVPGAINFMRQAITATDNKDLQWTDIDSARLEKLEKSL